MESQGKIEAIFSKVRSRGRNFLTEPESKEVLKEAGIPVIEALVAKSKIEAVEISKSIGFPVVLKVLSTNIIHKSDIGGVRTNLTTKGAVEKAYLEILEASRKYDSQAMVTVQKMAPKGTEVIVGVSEDPQFGKVLMFGLGGVWVEILKDVSFRLVPIGKRDAREMISEIKGYPLLEGFRGAPKVDMEKVVDTLLQVSNLSTEFSQIKEMDLNPILAYASGALVMDARILLG